MNVAQYHKTDKQADLLRPDDLSVHSAPKRW